MQMRDKLIAAGVGLFGYGVLIGWAVTGDRMEQKMKSNQLVLKELLDRKAAENEHLRRLLLNDPTVEELPEEEEKEIRIPIGVAPAPEGAAYSSETGVDTDEGSRERWDDDSEIPRGETPEETRRNLQGIIDRYTSNKDEVADFDSMVLANKEVEEVPPFVISREQFSFDPEEGDEYEKTTLNYYQRDRILLDEEEEVIEDPGPIVGWKNLSRFGDESGDADVVFIRNRWTKTDYEVVLQHEEPPIHVRYGMDAESYRVAKAAGRIRFRTGD